MSQLLHAHLLHLRSAGLAERTITDRQRVLTTLDRQLPYGIDHADADELTTWLANPDWHPWTRCTYHRHIRGFYRWATDPRDPRLTLDPSATLPSPRNPEADPDPVTDDQLRTALERSDTRWQLAIVLAAYAGLRATEIARLRREHVTPEHLTVRNGKGGKTAKLPTHPEIWRRVADTPDGLLLPAHSGRPYVGGQLPTRARMHFNRIGMPDVHLHRFRHWYATMLLRQGADIITVRDLMRHKSIKTTEAYLAIVGEQRRLAIRTLPALSSPQQEAA